MSYHIVAVRGHYNPNAAYTAQKLSYISPFSYNFEKISNSKSNMVN